MKKICYYLLVLLYLTSCTSGQWYKANSSQEEYSQTRYTCLQQAQQPESLARAVKNITNTNNPPFSGMITNEELFDACMNARGFYWKIME